MELMPRITRAQSMDILSSQANLAGYKAVIDAAAYYRPRLPDDDDGGGHGSAGQGVHHGCRRCRSCRRSPRRGASARSCRPPTCARRRKSRSKALVPSSCLPMWRTRRRAGGYAKELSAEDKAKQAALVAEHVKGQDIVITTALIPGTAGAGADHARRWSRA